MIDFNGNLIQEITNVPSGGGASNHFDISPDGNEIIFGKGVEDQGLFIQEAWIVGTDNTNLRKIMNSYAVRGRATHKTSFGWIDENTIVFSNTEVWSDAAGRHEFHILDLNTNTYSAWAGNSSSRSRGEGYAVWSPDYSKVAVRTMAIYTPSGIDIHDWPSGGNKKTLIPLGQGAYACYWLDNSHLVYSQGGELFSINIDSSEIINLTNTSNSNETYFIGSAFSGTNDRDNDQVPDAIDSDPDVHNPILIDTGEQVDADLANALYACGEQVGCGLFFTSFSPAEAVSFVGTSHDICQATNLITQGEADNDPIKVADGIATTMLIAFDLKLNAVTAGIAPSTTALKDCLTLGYKHVLDLLESTEDYFKEDWTNGKGGSYLPGFPCMTWACIQKYLMKYVIFSPVSPKVQCSDGSWVGFDESGEPAGDMETGIAIPLSNHRKMIILYGDKTKEYSLDIVSDGAQEGDSFDLMTFFLDSQAKKTSLFKNVPVGVNTTAKMEINYAPNILLEVDYHSNGEKEQKAPDNKFIECIIEGDLDFDGDVDRDDVNIIYEYKNKQASECSICDLDNDGMITILDARKLILINTFSVASNKLHVNAYQLEGLSYWFDMSINIYGQLVLTGIGKNTEGLTSNLPEPATFDEISEILHIPEFYLDKVSFWVNLHLVSTDPEVVFEIVEFGLNED
ncbi:hypothetical protein MTBBW1_2830005 [Desulfamplus magnetovallimortis]|uniref:Dockerin domain-containing protein n=1 Tax=Desulfamplus magnetovallimortis TaxID=1246637 RepID=A0A1W1HFD4_9BACT|nr:hypothetical protein MTBBW1_2830005 [Desulfamplus magnetovallimortis]